MELGRWNQAHAAALGEDIAAHNNYSVPERRLPTFALARAREDRRVARLDRLLAHSYAGAAWCLMPPRGSRSALLRYSLWLRLFRLCVKPEWRYRLRRMRRDLVSPADWVRLPLPDRLFWLYPLIRPFGWMLRRGPD